MDVLLPASQRLSTKIVGALIGFLITALFAICATLVLSWQLEGSSAAINEAGSLRMNSYRLTIMLSRVVNEPQQATNKEATAQQVRVIDATFARLQRGDPQRPLYLPPTANVHRKFDLVTERWQRDLRPLAEAVLQADAGIRKNFWQHYQPQIDSFVSDVDKLVHLIEQDSEHSGCVRRSWCWSRWR